MKVKINTELNNLPKVDYRTLQPLQGNFKTLSEKNKSKLLKSLQKKGFFVPFFVWKSNEGNFVLDGHQRLTVLKENDVQPFELPVVFIDAESKKDALEKLLSITSQYGKVNPFGLDELVSEFDLGFDFLADETTFDDLLSNDLEFENEIGMAGVFAGDPPPQYQNPQYAQPQYGNSDLGGGAGANNPFDFGANNKEINVYDFEDEMTLKLTFSEIDYNRVVSKLREKNANLGKALLDILFNE
jgi:hypothetical protein